MAPSAVGLGFATMSSPAVIPDLCTYFDSNYLCQAITLYRSLEAAGEPFTLWMLCLDEQSYDALASLALPAAKLIRERDLVDWAPELETARSDRSRVEFYYACTPRLVQYVSSHCQRGSGVVYLDADLSFFSGLPALMKHLAGGTVTVLAHESGDVKSEAEHGQYCVSIVYFSATEPAQKCLQWWADRCLESTGFSHGVWGDQKYLEEFPSVVEGVRVVRAPAVVMAPWNAWRWSTARQNSEVFVEEAPLVTYHFARLLMIRPNLFIPVRREYLSRDVLRQVYRPYMRRMRRSYFEVRAVQPTYRIRYSRRNIRGLILGMLLGRAFYVGDSSMFRLGVYVPTRAHELRAAMRSPRGRRLSTKSAVGAG